MNAEEFKEIRIARCQRGSEEHRMPARGEWEASFTFILSPVPDSEWKRLFIENRNAVAFKDNCGSLLFGHLQGEKFNFYCHPDQLQRAADKMKEIIARTNADYLDMRSAGSKVDDQRSEFEQSVTAAINALEL